MAQVQHVSIFFDGTRNHRLYDETNPVDRTEQRLLAGHTRLKPEDWTAGDRPWLIDLTAPFGGAGEIARELKSLVFAEVDVKTLKPKVPNSPVVDAVSLDKVIGTE